MTVVLLALAVSGACWAAAAAFVGCLIWCARREERREERRMEAEVRQHIAWARAQSKEWTT